MSVIRQALRDAGSRLSTLPHATPALEADILLAEALRKPRTYLHAWPDRELPEAVGERYEQLLERRLTGEPIAYILGRREFWSLELQVTPDTLIPRPETELLVATALSLIPADGDAMLADLGTGSGAVAAALASERPRWTIWATELSARAMAVAAGNFCRLRLRNLNTREGNWCQALPASLRFHGILSNPPYVNDADPHLRQGDPRYEPRQALAGGTDGLEAVRSIVAAAPRHLRRGGWLVLEHGYSQGRKVRDLMLTTGGYTDVTTYRDLSGQERVTAGVKG